MSFLIADLSGRALVRVAHVAVADAGALPQGTGGERRDEEEWAAQMPLDGGPVEHALRTQRLLALPPGASSVGEVRAEAWTVLAPVTERGEVLGMLEMSLPTEPAASTMAEITRTAHLLVS